MGAFRFETRQNESSSPSLNDWFRKRGHFGHSKPNFAAKFGHLAVTALQATRGIERLHFLETHENYAALPEDLLLSDKLTAKIF